MKPQNSQKHNSNLGEKRKPSENPPSVNSYSRNFDAVGHISSSFMSGDSLPDATSEKELGNEYFKQKKFKEAIDCYSRSIAFSPTSVAYANRAMAYLKIKRFHEAEDDCTEALNLDDRYIKAYSRRATARKELGKLKESIEDSEFALRLEPQNQEIKKQYAEVKSLYEKKALGTQKNSIQGMQKGGKPVTEVNEHEARVAPNTTTRRTGVAVVQEDHAKINHRTRKQELNASVQDLASRAASFAVAEAARNITPPKSAYEFEVSWRGFSGDRALQACLLKAISPIALPQIFKNALSTPILMDIIKAVATFFIEDTDLAVNYLENLTKVPRFDMLIMCLSSTDKAGMFSQMDFYEMSKHLRDGYPATMPFSEPNMFFSLQCCLAFLQEELYIQFLNFRKYGMKHFAMKLLPLRMRRSLIIYVRNTASTCDVHN